ncbi:MAG: Arm DNA-binding domain-containing protein, partial [Candidatus Protistobacter heckmanni]|nr:Arm DNA-binding domain-containing protein [Candidatus Protistobacter heckmanni]
MLTEITIRQAKTTGKPYTITDFDGLYLHISAVGGKAWHFRYTWLRQRTRISLGGYPELSLRETRELRDEARSLVARGINPRTERKKKRQAIKLAGENTFMAVYEKVDVTPAAHARRGPPKFAGADSPRLQEGRFSLSEAADYLQGHPRETFYDHIASMIFEVIFHASAVRSPEWGCWSIQHNSVWGELFNFNHLDGPAGRVVKFKVRQLLYDEIADMRRFANFKGAKILSFCLNVMGLAVSQVDYDKESRALQKAVPAWTKKNFVWLHRYNPRVAELCLVDGMTYDAENLRLVRTSPSEGLRCEPSYVYLELAPTNPRRRRQPLLCLSLLIRQE